MGITFNNNKTIAQDFAFVQATKKQYFDLNNKRLIESYHRLNVIANKHRESKLKRKTKLYLSYLFSPTSYAHHKNREVLQKEAYFLKRKIKYMLPPANRLKPKAELAYPSLIAKLTKKLGCPPISYEEEKNVRKIFTLLYENEDDLKVIKRKMCEVLKGAHVKIYDNGKFYDEMRTNKRAVKRHSSHYWYHKNSSQIGIKGKFLPEILCGKIIDKKENVTFSWFQLERHVHRTWEFNTDRYLHYMDWVKYKIFQKNIGPYGMSAHRDNCPLEIGQKKLNSR